jgi:ATP-binding cassette subfamily F protein 3
VAPPVRSAPEDGAKIKFEAQRVSARSAEKKKRRIQELETAIASGERDLDSLRGKLREDPSGDWERLAKMAVDEQALTKKVDGMLIEWARLSEED